MVRRILAGAGVVVSFTLPGCGDAQSTHDVQRASQVTSSRSRAKLKVRPNKDLLEGQSVSLTVSRLPAATEFRYAQCPAEASNFDDCINVSTAFTDETGSRSVAFPVLRSFWSQRARFVSCEKAHACSIVASTGDDLATAARVPLSFRNVGPIPIPTPALTVTPSTGLVDLQPVVVATSGFSPFVSFLFVQCTADWTSFQSQCQQLDGEGYIDPAGNVTFHTTVRRVLETVSGAAISCGEPQACVITAVQYDSRIDVPISFDDPGR